MARFLETHLEKQARERPEKDAFRLNGDAIGFQELQADSDRLQRLLSSLHIGPGDRVGIYMDKCLDVPRAVYGILKSGAAYVPLDTAAPAARTAGIIEDCKINILLTQPNKADSLKEVLALAPALTHIIGAEVSGVMTLAIDQDAPETKVTKQRTPSDPAYILFTSGSTGKPKGMVHTHASGLAYMDMTVDLFGFTDKDRMANQSPLHFDMAMLEFFSGISVGATVVIIPEVLTKLPASLSQLIAEERITTWYSVPFALIQLAEYGVLDKRDLTSLRWIIFGGAPMSNRHLHQLQTQLPDARFSNSYGPAEANQVTYYHLPKDPHPIHDPVPIGKPCEHTEIKITPEGELLIASTAMMEGYWNADHLNEKAFVWRDGQRFYKTGDLVKCSKDGDLEYLGRKDRQVKIRGFRIELDEVELAISSHPSVSEVAVLVSEDGLNLEAYVTPSPAQTADEQELQTHVRNLLPAAFVPAKIEIREAFTRTPTGKIDRTVLRISA